jgi:hypothetical protein
MREWNPDDIGNQLVSPRMGKEEQTPESQATDQFRTNLPVAAAAICHLACHSVNERIRLDAAKYVVERNLGRIGEHNLPSAKDPVDELIKEVLGHNG